MRMPCLFRETRPAASVDNPEEGVDSGLWGIGEQTVGVGNLMLKVPVMPAFLGSIVAGTVAGSEIQSQLADDDGSQSLPGFFGGMVGGLGVVDSALFFGLKIERQPGPFRTRWAVDGAEQLSRLRVSMHWGPKATLLGAMTAGLGFGVFAAAIQGMGTTGLGGSES